MNNMYTGKIAITPHFTKQGLLFLLGFMTLVFNVNAQHINKQIRSGNALYQDKKFAEAEQKYQAALKKDKDSKEAGFNLGDAYYSQKKFDEATEQFNAIAKTSTDKKLQSKAYHNLGNAYLQNKKYEESVNAYKNALKLNPEDEDSRYNLAYAKSKLVQQQQQQQKQDKKDNKDNKDNKDKQEKNNGDDSKNEKDKKEKNEQQQNKDQNDKNKEEKDKQNAEQNAKMSKEDAERLLNALQNKEKDLHDKMQKKPLQGVKVKIEKDW